MNSLFNLLASVGVPKVKPIKANFGEGTPLPEPERVLFQEPLNRDPIGGEFRGLENRSNTCYLNCVVQCIQYVPAWSNYLWHKHVDECKFRPDRQDECFGCLLARTTAALREGVNDTLWPEELVSNLSLLSKDFEGQQQDAHEFLICLLGKMQESVIRGKVDPYVEMTTAVGQIFGGFLRSQIACQECFHTSNTYEQYFNISLDIDGVDCMGQALRNFFTADNMDNDAWYRCDKCERKTMAAKRYRIETTPEVLIIQLKRYDVYGRKLDHFVKFPHTLNLDEYMSSNKASEMYRLYGIITHWGMRLGFGHYTALVTDPARETNEWYLLDDEVVRPITGREVSNRLAYMLFYIKRTPSAENRYSVMETISEMPEEENREEGKVEDEVEQKEEENGMCDGVSILMKMLKNLNLGVETDTGDMSYL